MKSLYSKLTSLVPQSSAEGKPSVPDRLSDAVNYIEELQARVEKLKDRKESLLEHQNLNTASCPLGKTSAGASLSPEIMIQEMGSALEVVIISSKLGCQLTFNEVVRVLHEEGAEIVGANFSVMGDIAFHCIHSEVEDSAGNSGARAAATISERLKKSLSSN